MRRSIVLLVSILFVLGAIAPVASAHVHGITPLLELGCTGVDNTVTGANTTDSTPAAFANGGPIRGLIPRDTGSAPLTVGDGGRTAPVAACP